MIPARGPQTRLILKLEGNSMQATQLPVNNGFLSSATCLDLPGQSTIRDRWLARTTCPSERLQQLLVVSPYLASIELPSYKLCPALPRNPKKKCLGSTRRYHFVSEMSSDLHHAFLELFVVIDIS